MTDRIVLTGAGGALGRAVACALLAHGHEVVASLGPPGFTPPRPPPTGLVPHLVDVRDRAGLADLLQGAHTVVHVAGPASVTQSFRHPALHASVHVGGTATVLEAAQAAGVSHLVYVSSAEVCSGGRVDEAAPLAPRSPYAVAKRAAEALLRTAQSDLTTTVIRPFLVVDEHPPRGLFRWVHQQRHDPAVQLADPDLLRDVVGADDVADLIRRAVEQPCTAPWRVFHAGRGEAVRIDALASALHRGWGGTGHTLRAPTPDRPMRPLPVLVADPRKARQELGWVPRLDLEQLVARRTGSP